MLHCFEALDLKIVLDVGSGSVHLPDDIAYDALCMWDEKPYEEIYKIISEKYGEEASKETFVELDNLVAKNQIGCPDKYTSNEVKLQGESVVKAMCLLVAHDCNMRCKYCFADTGEYYMQTRTLLSFETGKKAIDWLVEKSGNRHYLEIDFFGGEPLLNLQVMKDLVAYGRSIEKKYNKVFKFTVTTNGLAITDDVIEFVNKEMDNVVISIDGRKEVHDKMRPGIGGKSCYDVTMKNAKKLVADRKQQQYYIRGTYTKNNMDFTDDIFYLADQGFEQISLEPVVSDEKESYALTTKDLPILFKEYDKLAKLYLERRRHGKWFSFFHYNIDLKGGPCLRKRLNGCGVGNEYVAVTADGDIYPCHQFVGRDGWKMGSVLNDSFDKKMQAKFADNNVLNKKDCTDCWAKFYCSGGCTANAVAFNNDMTKPHLFECEIERKRLENAIAIYTWEQIDKTEN